MKTKIYGAYGSNMNIEQMRRRCPAAKVICNGILENYELTFRGRGCGVANIEQKQSSSVPFVLWEITSMCERALDRYEGYPKLYGKVQLPIVCASGDQREVMVYVMVKRYESMPALPSQEYAEIIWQGYKDNGLDCTPLEAAIRQTEKEI